MMTPQQIEALKRHFLEWSGGFDPESEYQIIVYVDYARDSRLNKDEVLLTLEMWMNEQPLIEI
jgi:hypothetical protein